MVAFSKPISTLPFSCYEVGHTWSPFCSTAALDPGFSCFEEGLKIYSSVYILSSILSGKIPNKNDLKRLFLSIIQSTLFLSCNGFGFISSFCTVRRIYGKFGYLTSAFIPSFIANFLAICVERPSRRPALAIYVTNVASETLYNMLVSRGLIKPIPHGQVLIFALTMAALFRWYRTTKDTKNFQYKLIRAVVGDQELKVTQPEPSPKKNGSILDLKHPLCPHNKGCLKYSFQVLLRRFISGWGIHASASLVLSLPQLLKKPSRLLLVLKQSKHIKFGAFLASLSGLYRMIHCVLRWLRGVDSPNHSILAGLVAGTSIGFYPNTTVILYMAWKTLETLYYQGIEAKVLPDIPGFAVLLYSFSTAILFHAAVLEPHNLKPAYWRFLMKITDNKIIEMNRHLLEVMGTNSSQLLPNHRPHYQVEHLTDQFKLFSGHK